jgi:hypothetical protein
VDIKKILESKSVRKTILEYTDIPTENEWKDIQFNMMKLANKVSNKLFKKDFGFLTPAERKEVELKLQPMAS